MMFVAYDVCCLMLFVAYDICRLMMFVAYDVCRIMMFVAYEVFERVAYRVCRSDAKRDHHFTHIVQNSDRGYLKGPD